MNLKEKLSEGLQSGFIDCNLSSLEKYNPKLLINDHKKGMKVLTSIENELRSCKEFYFSVAFITNSGITSLLSVLTELEEKNIKGKIITSQYQNFTEPKALKRLLKFKNIELRIVTEGNFHAKGYIFSYGDSFSFIIGSSNMTQNALGLNKEWNLKLSSLENGAVMQNIMNEFYYTFENATAVDDKWIDTYTDIYRSVKQINNKAALEQENRLITLNKINPNKMQVDAMKALSALRNEGKKKSLLISATGTGKTYLSAFDVKRYDPKRFLFVVHRENIARAAMESFKNIFGKNIDAGILSGNSHVKDKKYIFATIQTLSKDETLNSFDKKAFDYMVIDEVHRSGAPTYQKILNHFDPDFLLGMTATPERTDDYDIFSLFDHNIAYEIRLNKALEENMLAPFHYFGVSEITVEGRLLDEKTAFNKLVSEERINHIIETADFYGYSGDRVKGLVFCSKTSESKTLSNEFNKRGFSTISLTGDSSEEERKSAMERLEQNNLSNSLDYIFTVDIFNEGVDIPTINQIIMLRPTQSAIIFVQQLGRGLRKHIEKEYLTVIDFIGNYSNNYLVPIALYGDRSYNKDNIRKLVNTGSSTIPGCSTIHFDKITKERIYKSIDRSSMKKLADLKKDYLLMKYELGRIPMMMDFMELGGREPYSYVNSSGSYYNFLLKADPKNIEQLSFQKQNLLEFYSKEILNGKRCEESVILALLLQKSNISVLEINDIFYKNFGFIPTKESLDSAVHNLNGDFIIESAKEKYGIKENIKFTDLISMDPKYKKLLLDDSFHKYLDDMIRYDFHRFKEDFDPQKYRKGFILYQKYSRKDACRILNWEKNEESTLYGYKIKHNTCPIFVTYNKKPDISESTKYEDEFINPYVFSWMTRSRVRLDSREVIAIKDHKKTGLRIPLFIKKNDAEGTDFYYMGDCIPYDYIPTKSYDNKGRSLDIVNIKFNMEDEVDEYIFNYLES